MRTRKNQPNGEQGAILVHVAAAMIGLMAFSTFAIDYGVFWLGRRQAQNAADAGALAGAIALAYDDYNDRTATGPAQDSAVSAALSNLVFGAPPSVLADTDVTFPLCPDDGTDGCIRVDVYRTLDRGNPLPVFAGTFVGLTDQDVQATATAKVYGGNSVDCLRPFAVPDLPGDGYTLEANLGETVEFRDDPGEATGNGWFRVLDLIGGGQGGTQDTWDAIRTCAADSYAVGDTLQEQAGVVGNLATHINAMVALDPDASFNEETGQVEDSCADPGGAVCDKYVAGNGSNYTRVPDPNRSYSPRIVPMAVFDSAQYDPSTRCCIVITKFFGFFLLEAQGPPNFSLRGIIVTQPGMNDGNGGAVNQNAAFIQVIELIR